MMIAQSALPFEPIIQGPLCVRLAVTQAEIETAQHLRYEIFCNEIGAKATPEMAALQRDFDQFDPVCDHMLVIHKTEDGTEHIVGTYRLLLTDRAARVGRFYTEGEYNISLLKQRGGKIMELGRSCVHRDFRIRPVMQLLWRGIGAYVNFHEVELMFGCASFAVANVETHRLGLAYLHHFHPATPDLCPRALPEHYVDMNLMPKEDISEKEGFHGLPPLLKGYLRLGGMIGDGAVLDYDYNTTDVCIVVKTDKIGENYVAKFAPRETGPIG
ncbi:MAG: GNAT family N-acetyltransferase [Rickettsiales bacterium]|nr:GNAT family N-acetyltransferase [Rickettsiales bacterium]